MGLPALFAAAQLVAEDGLLAARVLALLAVAGTATLLYATLANIGERLGGVLGAFLYLLYMSRPDGLAANTEVINNLFITAASAVLFSEMLRPAHVLRTNRLFIAALLFGIGLQIKYVVLPEAVSLSCLVLVRAWLDGAGTARVAGLAGLAMLGGILPTVAATLYLLVGGSIATLSGCQSFRQHRVPERAADLGHCAVAFTIRPAAYRRTAARAAAVRGPSAPRTNTAVSCPLALAHRLAGCRGS